MKRLYLAILLLFLTTNIYSAPTSSISVTPVAVDGAVIQAADENNRNSTISSTYNAHSHTDITTLSSLSSIGTITTGVWTGTTIAIANGGTAATTSLTAFNNLVPTGVIVLWSGSSASIPSGWHLCDGTAGTPNLQDRFVIGAGSTYAVAATGGATTKTIAETNLPAHTHTGPSHTHTGPSHTHGALGLTGGAHTHDVNFFESGNTGGTDRVKDAFLTVTPENKTTESGGAVAVTGSTAADGTGASGAGGTGATGSIGSGTALDVLNPYYALCYIMKL